MMRAVKGFTLIELLTAMAVGALLVMACMVLLGTSRDGYGAAKERVIAEREMRAVLHQLESDLRVVVMSERMMIKGGGDLWLKDSLAFLCLKPDSAQGDEGDLGDLCAVRYYLKTIELGGKPVRCLIRGFDQSREVHGALSEGELDELLKQRLPEDEPIGFGVLEYAVRPVYRDDSGLVEDWQRAVSATPDWLEIRLVIVKPELRVRLEDEGDWDDTVWLGHPSDVSSHSGLEVVSARIRVGVHDGS